MTPRIPDPSVTLPRLAGPGSARQHGVLRGAVITTAAVGLGVVLGLGRDLLLAAYFGASGDTDAFLVAWTLPETAVPLLIDGAITLLLVPIFSRALQERHDQATASEISGPDPVRAAVAATLPQLVGALVIVAGLVAVSAPWLVPALAPGLVNVTLGVAAMRTIAVSVVFVGAAGYFAAALRSHLIYGPPAMLRVALNVGIIGVMVLGHRQVGILAAVLGAVIGSALMVAVQLPAFVRRVGLPRRLIRGGGVAISMFLPIAAYILMRQSQVFVERFVASSLAPGSITHLNYVQKIAQVPSTLAFILAVVTFPQLARNVVAGKLREASLRTAVDVQIIGAIVLASTAYLVAFAPQVVQFLLQRGAFTAHDTVMTAAILRLYVWGLLGQVLLDIVCRALFSERATFVPAVSMMLGLLVTAVVAVFGAPVWGASAIGVANALGITVSAIVVVCNRRSAIIPARTVILIIVRLLPATGLATAFALWLAVRLRGLPAGPSVVVGGVAVVVVFGVAVMLTRGLPLPWKLPPILRASAERAANTGGTVDDL
jgi:putative peptidoglycan lipid II flippase